MSSTPERLLLEQVALFRGLSPIALDEVARMAHVVEHPRGEAFFRQDTQADRFFVLVQGRVRIVQVTVDGQQVVVHYVNPGEMFGFASVFGDARYPGTAEVVDEARALTWDGAATRALMQRHPALALNALETLGARLREAQQRLRELSTERVERRVARAVLRLAKQAGKAVEGGVRIDFPLSRQDLAELTGTTLHTVSRILSAWEGQGLVETGRQRVVVRDEAGLERVAAEG